MHGRRLNSGVTSCRCKLIPGGVGRDNRRPKQQGGQHDGRPHPASSIGEASQGGGLNPQHWSIHSRCVVSAAVPAVAGQVTTAGAPHFYSPVRGAFSVLHHGGGSAREANSRAANAHPHHSPKPGTDQIKCFRKVDGGPGGAPAAGLQQLAVGSRGCRCGGWPALAC